MISSITLFPKSIDPKKIEDIVSKQISSTKSASGLKTLRVSDGDLMSPGGPPSYSKVVETTWESLEDFMAWAQNQSPEMQAEKKYLINNGAILLFYELKDI